MPTSTTVFRVSFSVWRCLAPCLKVEGRPDVRIGVRDRIVHIDNTETRLRTIVSIAGTENEPETGTTSLRRNDVQRYCFSPKNAEFVLLNIQKFRAGALRARVLCLPEHTHAHFRHLMHTYAATGTTGQSSFASQRGDPRFARESETAKYTSTTPKPARAPR